MFKRLFMALCLVLALSVSVLPAFASEVVADTSAPVETVESPGIDLPSVDVPDGPSEVELLTSINTYLTYLFAFVVLFLLVVAGKLVYSLFNMFF